jgi:hypothetical protein
LTLSKRVVLAFYGVGLTLICIWVPWRGGSTFRGANTEVLGYGFVWSGPERPVEFVEYDKRLADFNKLNKPVVETKSEGPYTAVRPPQTQSNEPDWRSGIVQPPIKAQPIQQPPAEPEGYTAYPYKLATSTVDYGRVLLELGALTGLFLLVWAVTTPGLLTSSQ